MRKRIALIVFVGASFATAAGVLVGPVQQAFAATCSTQQYASGKLEPNAVPAVGQTVSAGIDLVSDNIYSNSNVRGFILVDTANDQLRVGIRDMGNGAGPQLYAELNGTFIGHTVAANFQQFYSVSITRNSSSSWTAKVPGETFSPVTMTGSGVETLFLGVANNTSPNCSAYDYYFRNLSPWNTNSMEDVIDGSYSVRTISGTEFEADGP
jgi:hypothetical protein